MISIQIDPRTQNYLKKMVEEKIVGMKQINTQKNMSQIAKAVFTIATKDFIKSVNAKARADKGFSHMYEWGGAGVNARRLFLMTRKSIGGGRLVITTKYLNSEKPVPIKPELKIPGPTGKSVKSKHIFKNKAKVMEEGQRVVIVSRKTMVFPVDGTLRFVPPGHQIVVENPGGKEAKHHFTRYMEEWYSRSTDSSVEKSRLVEKIQKTVAKALNQQKISAADVSVIVKNISEQYSKNKVVM